MLSLLDSIFIEASSFDTTGVGVGVDCGVPLTVKVIFIGVALVLDPAPMTLTTYVPILTGAKDKTRLAVTSTGTSELA